MKDLRLRARLAIRTSSTQISRRDLADYVSKLHQKRAARACTVIFLNSTNQIINLWFCRSRSRRHFLNSLTSNDRVKKCHTYHFSELI